MKYLRSIILVVFVSAVKPSDKELFESDLGINYAHGGIELQPDVPLNLSDTSYFHLNSSDEVLEDEEGDVQQKRDEPEDEHNYPKGHEQFIAENFSFSGKNEDSSESVGHNLCKTFLKGGKQCTVCKSMKTNAQTENCVYSSTPELRKYAAKKERNYGKSGNEQYTYSSSGEEPSLPYANRLRQPAHYRTSEASSLDEKPTQGQPTHGTLGELYFSSGVDKIIEDDRLNCKLRHKDGNMCHYCKDMEYLRNEECVYIAEGTKPNSKLFRKGFTELESSLDAAFSPYEKQLSKRTATMHIQRRTYEVSENPRTFLYAKKITHATK